MRRESMLRGGKSGPVVVAGKPEESLLLKRIVSGQMPPEKQAKELAVELPTEAETNKIRAWIAAGAPGPEPLPALAAVPEKDKQFWSFQPPVRPAVPAVKGTVRNPIDAFLLSKLEGKGLGYSREADKLTLLRRATLDLTGLPPTPAEIADIAYQVNQSTQNIGARRLHTIMERLLEQISFAGPEWPDKTVNITADYVRERLKDVVKDQDLSRYIL